MIRLLLREFVVPLAPQAAWEFLARVEEWPRWARHIRRIDVQPVGPLSAASAGTIVLRNGIRSVFRMTEFDPPRSWKWAGPFLGLTIHYDHRFEPVDVANTRFVWAVDAEGFGASVLGRFFAAIYARSLDRAIRGLMALLGAPPP